MATRHASSPILFGQTPQTSNPYSEHPVHLGGVRHPTPLEPDHIFPDPIVWEPPAPSVVTASLELDRAPSRSWRFPLFSVGLNALGQMILGAAIAVGAVGPVVGALVCLVWMVCGLLLIAAHVLSMASDQ
ncbi:MAG: hypothetical protein AAGA65_30010 [Actinomycetota bacterium]